MDKTPFFCSVIGLSLLLTACGSALPQPTVQAATTGETAVATPVPVTPSATPDLCTAANMPQTAKIVNTYVYQFVNYSTLSVQIPPTQLTQLIASMKSIRQGLQQQTVPPCLTDLKHYALQYMDAVIQTESTFQSQPTPDKAAFDAGRQQALKYNDQYAQELARLLGVTLAAPSETSTGQETATPAVTMVVNPGPNPLNLHVAPSLTSQSIGMLNANESARALGKSANGEWVQIEVPGQAGTKAWVYASLVQYTSGDESVLPVATP